MIKRKNEIKTTYTGYLKDLKREALTNPYYRKEFKKWKKKHPSEIKREIIKYTSKDIAKKFFGTEKKAPLVRKIFERGRKRNCILEKYLKRREREKYLKEIGKDSGGNLS